MYRSISLFFCLASATLLSTVSLAQETELPPYFSQETALNIDHTKVEFEKEVRPALTTYLQIPADVAGDRWERFVEERYNTKTKSKRTTYTTEDVVLSGIFDTPVTLIAEITPDERGTRIEYLLRFTNGNYFNPAMLEAEADKLKATVREYSKAATIAYYNDLLEDLRSNHEDRKKDLAKSTDDLTDLNSESLDFDEDIAKLNEDINKEQERIRQAELAIQEYKNEISSIKAAATEHERAIEAAEATVDENTKQVEATATSIEKLKAKLDSIK